MKTLICSSGSIAGIQKLINDFFYSHSYRVNQDLTIINYKGPVTSIIIKKRKNRYLAYLN